MTRAAVTAEEFHVTVALKLELDVTTTGKDMESVLAQARTWKELDVVDIQGAQFNDGEMEIIGIWKPNAQG